MRHPFIPALLVTVLASSSAFAEDQSIKNFRFCLDSIDQRIAGKDAENLAYWKTQCEKTLAAVSGAAKGTSDFATQKARWDKQLAVIDPLLNKAQQGGQVLEILRAASLDGRAGGNKLIYIKSGDSLAIRIDNLTKGVVSFEACLKKLGDAKAIDSGFTSVQLDEGTAGDLVTKCTDGKSRAQTTIAELEPQWKAEGRARAKELYNIAYVKLVESENYPDKLEGTKDPLDAIDLFDRYHFLAETGMTLHRDLEALVASYPFIANDVVVKGVTVTQMKEKAQVLWEKGNKGKDKWKAKSDAAFAMYDKELKKALSGDRLRIVNQQGRPSWTSNMNDRQATIRANLRSYAKASWFRYDGNSCNTFYYFSGAKLTKTKREGVGCR